MRSRSASCRFPSRSPGWVLIEVKAFGLNRSELHTRLGLAEGVTFPRVLGIEAVGVVAAAPGGEFEPGPQVAAMMGGMGRTFDGGYARVHVRARRAGHPVLLEPGLADRSAPCPRCSRPPTDR